MRNFENKRGEIVSDDEEILEGLHGLVQGPGRKKKEMEDRRTGGAGR